MASNQNKTYHEEQNMKDLELLRNLLKDLPGYVKTFTRGIENRTLVKTRLNYVRDIKTFFEYEKDNNPAFKNKEIKDISLTDLDTFRAEDIEEYLDYMRYYIKDGRKITNGDQSIKRKIIALRVLYAYLYKNEMVEHNPAVKVDMPKLREKAIIRMETDEVVEFLDNVEYGTHLTKKQLENHNKSKTRDLALLTLMLGTGIRISECVGLDINDVDFKEQRIHIIRKGGKEAFVYFGDEVADSLMEYIEQRKNIVPVEGHDNALFLSSQRKRISVRSVENMVKKYSQSVTPLKHITPHKLRSTYGTALYQESGDIYLVADVLGHSDVNTTRKHYADIDEYRKRSARNMVKLREP